MLIQSLFLVLALPIIAFCILAERKVIAWVQRHLVYNTVGYPTFFTSNRSLHFQSLGLVGFSNWTSINQLTIFNLSVTEFLVVLMVSYLVTQAIKLTFNIISGFFANITAGTLLSSLQVYLIYWFHPVFRVGLIVGAFIVNLLNYLFSIRDRSTFLDSLITWPIMLLLSTYAIISFYILNYMRNFKYHIMLFVFVEYSVILIIFFYTGGWAVLYGLLLSGLTNSFMERPGSGSQTMTVQSPVPAEAPSSPMRPLQAPSSPMRPIRPIVFWDNDNGGDSPSEDPYRANKSNAAAAERASFDAEHRRFAEHCDRQSREPNASQANAETVSQTTSSNQSASDTPSNVPTASRVGVVANERLSWIGWYSRSLSNVLRQHSNLGGQLSEVFLLSLVAFSMTRRMRMRRVRPFSTFMLGRNRILFQSRSIHPSLQPYVNRMNRVASSMTFATPLRSADLDDYWSFNRWALHAAGKKQLPYDEKGKVLYYWLSLNLGTSALFSPVLMWILNNAHLFLK